TLLGPELAPDAPPAPARGGLAGWRDRRIATLKQPESIITLLVVAAAVIYTFFQLQPNLLFSQTTPAGGDMGAHVWLPQFVKDHLIPHLRITGWTPDNYDGFPVLTYYFPLPIFAIAFASYVIPYDVAFKLISVLGLLALPVCAWAFGRLARMKFPGPACLAAATLPFLFSREFTIYGGNIASTMAGEFSFSISLAFALLFLGVVARGLENGRHRALAAVLLACCAFSHILPLFFALGGAVVMLAMRFDRKRVRWLLPVLVVGGLVTAVWALPFELRLPYATNMGYEKLTTYLGSLFPAKETWLFVLAGIGVALSLSRRNRIGTWLGIMAALAALAFRLAPQGRLWNARVLPFWYLCLYLLAGVAVCEIGTMITEWATTDDFLRRCGRMAVPVVAVVVALGWVAFPLNELPGEHLSSAGHLDWLGLTSPNQSFVVDWVKWNYSGYQSSGKARRNEYFALVNEMKKLGKDPAFGCGRAMWEYEPELDQMGTPDALMLLPYWTNGCINSDEGLYYESSATTPYHFLDAAELSSQPSNPVRGLNYPSGIDVQEGVQHLQMLGIKYFMALTPDVQQQAAADDQLTQIASVGPFPVSYTSSSPACKGQQSCTVQRTWKIYQVAQSAEVAPLVNQPVVMTGSNVSSQAGWLKASEAWYLDSSRWGVVETASGPKSWARVSAGTTNLPTRALPPVQVSGIKEGTSTISFNVDQTGVPVLVKTSYYPNWQVSGAKAVYRATPNLMVVVPTANHVTLSYGYTTLDWVGFVLTLLGLAGVVVLWRLGPVVYSMGATRRSGLHSGALLRGSKRRSASGPAEASSSVAPAPGWPTEEASEAEAGRGPAPPSPETEQLLGEPYQRLGKMLAETYPDGLSGDGDGMASWLGLPTDRRENPSPPPANSGPPTTSSD
ncbi:MAG: hypothetical protein J2P57_13370, partial [Acidimicrobiaceae bacterium]|nr:hypothetical protein [Acidimicrobiaceae bacterium]